MGKLSPQKRAEIAALHNAGLTDNQIAKKIGCTRATVSRWKNERSVATPFQDKKRSGRPSKLTPALQLKIQKIARAKKRRSTRIVARQLRQQKLANISHESVRQALRSGGLSPFKRRKQPRLLERHIRQRKAWLRRTNNEMWSHVVFSDEKLFYLVRPANRSHDIVWAANPHEVPPEEVVPQSSRLHVWGAISSRGKTKLAFLEGPLNAPKYVKILEQFLLPAAKKQFGDEKWCFMQDHATAHDAKSTQAWIRENVPSFFDSESWPAKSPDLNPIENLWAILEEKCNREAIATKSGFKSQLAKTWNQLEQSTITHLIDSMPERRKALRKAKGGHIQY